MRWVADLLASQSLLLLFVVAALGYAIGSIKIKGVSLGVAAVLFVGLAFNAADPDYALPAVFTSLGLVVFVYTIGIASGPSFVAVMRSRGLRDSVLPVAVIVAAGLLAVGLRYGLHLDPAVAAGAFTGALTNTPAMAGLVQFLGSGDAGTAGAGAELPVVGYAIGYPMGVIGPILAITFWQSRFGIDYRRDARRAKGIADIGGEIYRKTVRVTDEEAVGHSLPYLASRHEWQVLFGRVKRGDEQLLSVQDELLVQRGDLVTVLGALEDVERVVSALGEEVPSDTLTRDHSQFGRHGVFISNRDVAAHKIRELRLPEQFDAMITRVRRGDIDMLPHKDFVLEFGDQVRVICPADQFPAVRAFLGDSYRATSNLNLVAVGLGLVLGLLVGSVPVDLPGGIVFKLGEAGGPLVVGLLLGALRRTGPIVWGIPYSANLTLREFGLVLMLAGIGTRSGQAFVQALGSAEGLRVFLGAAVISFLVPFVFIPIAYRRLGLPFAMATGMTAAVHTQPAVHAYAVGQAGNDLPNHGYAIVFPVATILKIILAQVILIVLLP